jgi:hypothetical protein
MAHGQIHMTVSSATSSRHRQPTAQLTVPERIRGIGDIGANPRATGRESRQMFPSGIVWIRSPPVLENWHIAIIHFRQADRSRCVPTAHDFIANWIPSRRNSADPRPGCPYQATCPHAPCFGLPRCQIFRNNSNSSHGTGRRLCFARSRSGSQFYEDCLAREGVDSQCLLRRKTTKLVQSHMKAYFQNCGVHAKE